MTNPETVACRTTQHCAFHGWCRRCDPAFAAVMSRVNVAIQRTDADDTHWGPLYAAVADALRPAAVSVPPPATRADDQAAVLRWAADWFDSGIRSVSRMFGHQAAAELRRMADEATPVAAPSPPANEPGPAVAVSRPDVLRWAAELVAADTAHIRYGSATDYANRHAALLRRAADDAQGPCVAGEQQNETPEAVEHMLTRMRADAATDSFDGLLRIIADWYRSSEGRDVLFEDLIAAGYRLPERTPE